MGLLDKIKQEAQKSGEGKSKFFYVKSGAKKRIRFIQDMEDGFEVPWHKVWDQNVNHPCQTFLGKKRCPFCEAGNDPRPQYAWSVWDYDSSEVKILMFGVNRCSPVDAIVSAYDTYGTIKDRDYVLSVSGTNTDKRYSVMPTDKSKFRNDKAKPYTRPAFIKLLSEAYSSIINPTGGDSKSEGGWDNNSMNDPEPDYNSMSAKQLYDLCKERDIEAKPKKDALYYIELLEASDAKEEPEEEEDWGEEDGEDKPGYSSMSPMELFKLCQERRIEAEKKKPKQYYVRLLEEADEAEEDWGGDEDEEEEWADE